jgi:multidrug resistance efflux pump
MLEVLICSLFTVLPDYLYRHYAQGKRFGKEITLFSVWYELRWGIVGCLLLTVSLITVIFYHHPTSTNVVAFYRTVPIMPEASGRVGEVYVGLSGKVAQGERIFRLESSKQEAALELARRRVAEIDASMVVSQSDVAAARGQVQQAQASLEQALDELRTKEDLNRRNPDVVARREIERLQNTVEARRGGVSAANASLEAAQSRVTSLLPAQRASAEAALAQAQVDMDKTVITAGVAGRVEQFTLRVGDIVSPIMRPAGILIPETSRRGLQAGFGQIEAQVMKVGMIAEVTCISKPLAIIPMVVVAVQDFIAAGQFRNTEQLVDVQQVRQPGSITVFLEPLYAGGLDDVPPGSSCIANAYSNNHDELARKDISFGRRLYLHMVDTVALVHAAILRAQALLLPVRTLVLGGH